MSGKKELVAVVMVVNINKVVLKANGNAKNGGPSLHGANVQ